MNTENAYSLIAESLIAKAGDLSWDNLIVEVSIFNKMCSSTYWVTQGEKKIQGSGKPSLNLKRDSLSAILFLRDNLLVTTGQRIWGLIFTLYPNGKFNIEYDYNKPEGYEETDELISGNEINQALNNIVP